MFDFLVIMFSQCTVKENTLKRKLLTIQVVQSNFWRMGIEKFHNIKSQFIKFVMFLK